MSVTESAHALLLVDGRYALQLRDDKPGIVGRGLWGFFGGALAEDEPPAVGLTRELYEELEIRVAEPRLLWTIEGTSELSSMPKRWWFFEVDATDELDKNFVVFPHPRLFALFDKYWMTWNPNEDALRVAARLLANQGAGMPTAKIATEFSWSARRLNPALSILIDNNVVRTSNARSHPEIKDWVQATDATRRYVKHGGATRID